mmetsp:Transcript_41779/g.108198  ORF Transcript_41779/g.108198 Transcript_41779/m.108198 type:complete len:208 (+) Transcript_41779:61-684(+)
MWVRAVLLLGVVSPTASHLLLRRGGAVRSWGSVSVSRNGGKLGCPVDYDVPLDLKGHPSSLHVPSVNNFIDDIDRWWTEERVERYYSPLVSGVSFKIAPSPISGCGMRSIRLIKAGEKVGPVWVPDDHWTSLVHFTPWFGRAINHCPDSNTHLAQMDDKSVWTVASRDIQPGEELTGNYNEAHSQFPQLVSGADPSWTCKKPATQEQ